MNEPDIKNRQVRRLLLVGSIITILITISPYVFYLYEIFPETQTWRTPFFTLKTSYHSSLYVAAWSFANKLMPLYLLFIWFLTCRHWWHHVIFIPITMYVYQITSIIDANIRYVEEIHLYHVIPAMLLIIPIAYLLRVKLLNPMVKGVDVRTLDIEKNKTLKKVTFTGILVVLLIAASPFVFYIYRNFPEDSNTVKFFFFTLRSVQYSNIHVAVWNFVNKFIPLYFLLLWFLTCRYWWKPIILIPMIMYIFQLFTLFNSSIRYVDEMEIYWVIPVMLATTAVVYISRLKLFYKVVKGIDIKKMDEELKNYEANKDDHS